MNLHLGLTLTYFIRWPAGPPDYFQGGPSKFQVVLELQEISKKFSMGFTISKKNLRAIKFREVLKLIDCCAVTFDHG